MNLQDDQIYEFKETRFIRSTSKMHLGNGLPIYIFAQNRSQFLDRSCNYRIVAIFKNIKLKHP